MILVSALIIDQWNNFRKFSCPFYFICRWLVGLEFLNSELCQIFTVQAAISSIWNLKLQKGCSNCKTVLFIDKNTFFGWGHPQTCQAQAENVKLLCSCQVKVGNEEVDNALIGAPQQVMSVKRGSVCCYCSCVSPPPTDRSQLPFNSQLLFQLEQLVLDIIIGTPSLPSCNCHTHHSGHWIVLNCCFGCSTHH